MKYITFKEAAKMVNMEYEAFRYWVKKKKSPKPYFILGRICFNPDELKVWKPPYSKNWGGNRYKDD